MLQRVVPVLKGKGYVNLFGALRSPATKATYAFRLKQYLSYLNMHTPDELLLMDNATAQKKIIEYILYLRNEGLSRSSLEGVSATLRKFYAMNDIQLNWDKIHAYLGEDEKTIEDEAYTHQQVKRMLQFGQLRTRVVILLLASSGIRIGAIAGLRKKHLTYIEKYGLYQITIYPKANQRYVTFCTPECASEINSYFDYRRSCGESIGDESPVIRKDFDPDRPGQRIEPATVKALKFILERIVRNAGLKMKHEEVNGRQTQRTKIMLVHGLRKFYCTNLGRARLQSSKIDALMGWKKGLLHVYDRSGLEELLEEYVKAIDLLTIHDENRLKAKVATLEEDKDRMIQELTKTVEEMRGQVQPKDKELQELRNEIKVLQEKKDNEIQLIKKQLVTVEKHQMEIIARIMSNMNAASSNTNKRLGHEASKKTQRMYSQMLQVLAKEMPQLHHHDELSREQALELIKSSISSDDDKD